jgi:hypothetical protein
MSNSNNRNNNGNNVFNDLNSTDLLFINILNTIYNDNLRIIHQLLEQNSEVTNNLISFLNNRRRETFANNNFNQENTNANININPNPNDRRIFIDSIPYYLVDELQFFTIPNVNNTNINTNPNTANLRTNANTNRGRYHRRNNINTDNLETMPTPIGRMTGIMNSFFQPINIVPTQTQIENATSNITYGEIVEPINTSCPISLETFIETSEVVMIKQCKHVFNKQSLMSWFNSSCRCPVCRYDIRDYVDAENNETTNETATESTNENATADMTTNTNTNENVDTNPNILAQEHMRNIRNITDQTVNILENLFQDALYDLSYNRIQFSFP